MLSVLSCFNDLKAQYYSLDDLYRQAERAADAAEQNAAATGALLNEQKRANQEQEEQRRAQLYLEAKRQAEEQKQRQLKRDQDVSSSGDGVSAPDLTASQLGWYYRVYPIQKLPNGILADSWVPANNIEGYKRGGILAFIETNRSLSEGAFCFISAYKSGTYNYTDNTGIKRIVPRYVLRQVCDLNIIQYNLGSIKEL